MQGKNRPVRPRVETPRVSAKNRPARPPLETPPVWAKNRPLRPLACHLVTPNHARPGDIVRLRGRGFGRDIGKVDVWLAGTPAAQIRRVSDDEIEVKVPAGSSGLWKVEIAGVGQAMCPGTFVIDRWQVIPDRWPRRGGRT